MSKINCIIGTMTFGESVFYPESKELIEYFLSKGYSEIDTAHIYNNGDSEKIIGESIKDISQPFKIATKLHPGVTGNLNAESVRTQFDESLSRMGIDSIDLLYLHFPDLKTPVEETLRACNELHKEGKFREFGLSNFPAWMVADIWNKCEANQWIKPTVYEGVYNPLSRRAEEELNLCLNTLGLRFYAYNPLAGGLLSGKYTGFEQETETGRFANRKNYKKRYWKKSMFDAIDVIRKEAEKCGISLIEASYRWLAHHSMLDADRGDGILIGASKPEHLKQNLAMIQGEELPENVVQAFDRAWMISKNDSPAYFSIPGKHKI